MDLDLITQLLKLLGGKVLIDAFDFLQHHNVRCGFLKPFGDSITTHLDGIYVKSCNSHMEKLVPQPQEDVAFGF